ncbi:MAG: GDSL-type esterase/lipase family protein [Acidimicrobiales bacterium]
MAATPSDPNPSSHHVRYFDTRPSPRRFALIGALGAVVVVLAAVVAWIATDGFGRDDTSSASQLGTNGLPVGEAAAPDATDAPDDAPEGLGVMSEDATSVVMVGDSITQGSTKELEYVLTADGFTDITIDGVTSRRIVEGGGSEPESGVQAVTRLLADGADPDVWVIALGTNDIAKYGSSDEYGAVVQQLLDLLPDDVPLVWVDAYRDDYPDDSVEFDDALRARLGDRDGTVVASWYDVASADPSILRDRVHPKPDGRAKFASVVIEGLQLLR